MGQFPETKVVSEVDVRFLIIRLCVDCVRETVIMMLNVQVH